MAVFPSKDFVILANKHYSRPSGLMMSHPGGIVLFQRFQHLSGILDDLHHVEVDDNPAFVDQIGGAHHAHADLAVVFLLLPDVVGPDDFSSGSDRSVKGNPWAVSNFLWDATLSRLIPRITAPFSRNWGIRSRKLQHCFVQPEVMSLGYPLPAVVRQLPHIAVLIG